MREAANLAKKKNPEYEKLQNQKAALNRLQHSMLEVICSNFALKNVKSMKISKLYDLVTVSCGKMEFSKLFFF